MNIKYLTLEQLLLIHELQIEEFGGSYGIRDLNGLDSAIMRPQSSFGGKDLYVSFFDKAAALMHSVILNHAFVDGNKRTGMVSGIVFLEMNGFKLEVEQEEFSSTARSIANKEISITEISKWLKNNSKKFA